jgi:hypothetical protein
MSQFSGLWFYRVRGGSPAEGGFDVDGNLTEIQEPLRNQRAMPSDSERFRVVFDARFDSGHCQAGTLLIKSADPGSTS